MKPFNDDGALDHALIPRWRKEADGAYDFQINFDGRMIPHHAKRIPGYGAEYKTTVRRMQPAALHLAGFAKVYAKAENRVTVDPKTLDPNGIPIPVVQFRFDERDVVHVQSPAKERHGNRRQPERQNHFRFRRQARRLRQP